MPLVILTVLIGLWVSNFQINYWQDLSWIREGAGDIISYRTIALSAPSLPPSGTNLFYHHSQRIFTPYVIGLVNTVIVTPIDMLFLVFTLAALFLSAKLLDSCLEKAGMPHNGRLLLVLTYLLNPYVSRYYIGLPAMITDVGFGLGLLASINGSLSNRFALTFAGLVFAALNRQTALAVAPFFAVAEYCGVFGLKKGFVRSLALIIAPATIYVLTGVIAKDFSMPSSNLSTIIGIFSWIKESASLRAILEFALRGVFPFFTAVAIIGGAFRRSDFRGIDRKVLFFVTIVAAICAQPLLGGPLVTGQSITRLNSLGLGPLLIATAFVLKESFLTLNGTQIGLISCLLGIGSMHHIYSFNGSLSSERAPQFLFLVTVTSFLIVATLRFGGRWKDLNAE